MLSPRFFSARPIFKLTLARPSGSTWCAAPIRNTNAQCDCVEQQGCFPANTNCGTNPLAHYGNSVLSAAAVLRHSLGLSFAFGSRRAFWLQQQLQSRHVPLHFLHLCCDFLLRSGRAKDPAESHCTLLELARWPPRPSSTSASA